MVEMKVEETISIVWEDTEKLIKYAKHLVQSGFCNCSLRKVRNGSGRKGEGSKRYGNDKRRREYGE